MPRLRKAYDSSHQVFAGRKRQRVHPGALERLGQLRLAQLGGFLEALTPREACAVDFARQVAHTRTCDDATFERMQSLFTPEEITDLVVTTAWYHLCAVILGTIRVELEQEDR